MEEEKITLPSKSINKTKVTNFEMSQLQKKHW